MEENAPNIVLIGLRGSGKSTLGVRLAESLGRSFVDLDDVSARVLGCDGAGEAIAKHGMEAFRKAECDALGSVLEKLDQVVSLGGGDAYYCGVRRTSFGGWMPGVVFEGET